MLYYYYSIYCSCLFLDIYLAKHLSDLILYGIQKVQAKGQGSCYCKADVYETGLAWLTVKLIWVVHRYIWFPHRQPYFHVNLRFILNHCLINLTFLPLDMPIELNRSCARLSSMKMPTLNLSENLKKKFKGLGTYLKQRESKYKKVSQRAIHILSFWIDYRIIFETIISFIDKFIWYFSKILFYYLYQSS